MDLPSVYHTHSPRLNQYWREQADDDAVAQVPRVAPRWRRPHRWGGPMIFVNHINTYTYMYEYVYVCMSVYIYVYTYMYIYVYMYIYILIYIYIYIFHQVRSCCFCPGSDEKPFWTDGAWWQRFANHGQTSLLILKRNHEWGLVVVYQLL